jgi:Polyketide cyclase / dehydrase and lipid transport
MRLPAWGRSRVEAPPVLNARSGTRFLVATLATFGGFLAQPAPAADNDPDLSWLDHAVLDRGDVQVHPDQIEHGVVHMRFAVKVTAPVPALWNVLKDCPRSAEYTPNIVSCRSLEIEDDGRAELFTQTVKIAFFVPSFEHVFRLSYDPYTHIGVHRVSGPINVLDGNWWLVPQADASVLLVNELAIDIGLPIPRFLVRATMRREVPKMLSGIRDRAQARH